MKTVRIERGLPGSGKSHDIRRHIAGFAAVAEALEEDVVLEKDVVICSADDYFMVDGEYQFDPSKLALAHNACMKKYLEALTAEKLLIFVDNTNSQRWEFENYVLAGRLAGYKVEVTTSDTSHMTVEQLRHCAERNVHGVPAAAIAAMAMRWEE